MTIRIHIRVSEGTWDEESELAQTIADKINQMLETFNIPVYIIPVSELD